VPEAEVVSARAYLTDSRYLKLQRANVYNLCRSYRYQSTGYYVSLLAQARGHRPRPSVLTIQDMKSPAVLRGMADEFEPIIQRSLSRIRGDDFELSIYFGRNLARRYDPLCLRLSNLFEAPLLRARFVRGKDKRWALQQVQAIAGHDVPAHHREAVGEFAREYFSGRRGLGGRRRKVSRYDLAILFDPADPEPPSDERAIRRFQKAAEELGMGADVIGKDDYARLPVYDALFIRETTAVNHHTYRFAQRAAKEGLIVIDDPASIVRCTNKVYLAEIFERHKVPSPRTRIVHKDNIEELGNDLGFPLVIKRPDSSFSLGVAKAADETELRAITQEYLAKSEFLVAQEFVPTEYDWRVGVLENEPLYGCRYHMADNHWQIMQHGQRGTQYGNVDTIPLDLIPKPVVRAAVKAARLIGDGLYGVDVKQVGNRIYVMEVNDNPSLEAGIEDYVLGDQLYRTIMSWFLKRLDQRAAGMLRS
jgi:glutathione synthase/RimK-type ligase-like ATP-grasp enzyme